VNRACNAGRFFYRDDGCDGKTTLGVTAELHYEQHVDVYVGMPCSEGSQPRPRRPMPGLIFYQHEPGRYVWSVAFYLYMYTVIQKTPTYYFLN